MERRVAGAARGLKELEGVGRARGDWGVVVGLGRSVEAERTRKWRRARTGNGVRRWVWRGWTDRHGYTIGEVERTAKTFQKKEQPKPNK